MRSTGLHPRCFFSSRRGPPSRRSTPPLRPRSCSSHGSTRASSPLRAADRDRSSRAVRALPLRDGTRHPPTRAGPEAQATTPPPLAWELYERDQALGILDARIGEFNSEEVLRVISIALLCTQGSPHQRPPMSRVVKMLTGDIEVTEVVTKPSYITEWQRRGGNTSYVTSDYSGGTTGEFSMQRDTIAPLTPSPEMTGVIEEGR